MDEIVKLVLGGIAAIALIYVLLHNSSKLGPITNGITNDYGQIASTFQGK